MFGLSARKDPARILSGILALIIMVGALLALASCGDSGGNITPPPATIIRAVDSPTANATPAAKGQGTAVPVPPKVTSPSSIYPAETPIGYPVGGSAYPSPAK